MLMKSFMYKSEILSIYCQSSSSKCELEQKDASACSLSTFWVSGIKWLDCDNNNNNNNNNKKVYIKLLKINIISKLINWNAYAHVSNRVRRALLSSVP